MSTTADMTLETRCALALALIRTGRIDEPGARSVVKTLERELLDRFRSYNSCLSHPMEHSGEKRCLLEEMYIVSETLKKLFN